MYTQNQFSCFIIGEGTLPIQCGELLLERGHKIFGVISCDASISSWAKRKDIPHIQQTDNLVAFLSQQPFDYLFSIVNNSVLPKEILELPRQLAINYHDALLPRYAGVNATSWALMHGEKTHGVTWHVMTAMVDAGNILKQISVEINSDETAFTLNGKCYEAAICSFAELIDELSSGQALVSKPNLDERTYFGRYKRPRAGGVLSFNCCAHDIDALVRALDFGPYPNPLGLPKLVIGNNSIVVSKLEVLSDQAKSPPGTITAIEPSFLKVSTASYDLALHQVLTIGGQVLPIPDLVARFGLQVGYRFKDIEPDRVRRIERFDALIAKHEAFWVERLTTLQPITIPYAQRTVSHLNSKQYASVEIPISLEISTFLEKRHPAWNLGEFLEAAFTTYLARIGETECFDIGFRDVKLQQEMVGLENLFASHVPCRVNIGYEQSFEEVFEAFKKQVELTKLHLTYGRDVVCRYPALRSLSQTECEQMFSVVVERVEKLDNYQAEPGNELTLVIASDGKECFWFYNAEAFDGDSIARMQDQFAIFLQGIVTDPTSCVAEIPLLSDPERHKILVDWNDTQADYPKDKCIHQLFEAQVEQTPDAVAVFFEEEQLTYKELNQRANQLAHYLGNLGVGPEILVGICVERSLEMVVGLLGILKAGGAYVPLDPSYPSERLAFMLEDSSVSVLLTQASLVEALPKHQARVLCLDTDALSFAMQTKSNPISGVMPKNLAYVIYTSGSTGKPKGAMNTHQAICNRLLWMQDTYQLTEADRVLQKTPFSFDVSVWEFFWPLLTGARLVIAKQDGHRDPGYLVKAIVQQQITTLHFVPSMLQIFLEEQGLESCSCLRRVICSGEALPHELVERFFVRLECELHNLYGPTEAAIDVTFWQCKRDSNLKTVPIGRPIANTQLYILDRYLQPVPVGVAGELYIGGDGVARGYLNRPELTNEKFISHHAQMRLYKTGDKARYLPDGNIEYLGRFDNQVKIRGFRIELGEIETAIAQHTAVRETVVIAREDVPDQKYLAAYIVPNHSYAIATRELRGFLKQKLPDYMIPGVFVVLDALPLTPNGKVDRRALPAPEFQPELQQSLLAPRTPIEEMLTSIWADLLRIELVGVHQNFFELGGHSLLATQVISRVRDSLGVELPLRSLFEAPTIAQLASRVELELKNGQSQEAEPLLPIPRSESIPLSFAQTRLWFLDQLQPLSAFYNIPLALRLSGQLNIAALESSINEIIQRHEALRTNFTTQEGQPVQIIASTLNLKLLVVDLLYLPESSREIEAQRLAFEEVNRPFNLERDPLVRGTALQLGETEYILVLTMHHIISDGWSLGIFVKELTELYKAFCTGSPPVLPLLPVQYADFAVWQRQWLSGEVLKTQLDYWKEQLKNAPNLLELPTDRPRKAVQTFQGGYYYAAFDKDLSAELTALSKRSGVTLFMTLVAAFQTLLYRLSGEDDIVVGTPVAGRNRREIEGLIGFFVNTLVLRTNLGGDPSFEELLGSVREVALQAYTHQDLPFEQLVQTLQPTRDLSYTPLFQVMFVLDDAGVPSVKLPELTVSSYSVELGTAKFDLTLSMENTADGLTGVWEYNADLFDKATIARMAGHFQTLLEAIVANPQQKVCSLPLLTEQERHQLLVDWNNTTKEYPSDKCIHQLFEEQVELTPDAEAVLFEDKQLTYRELNQRANCLAHHLRNLGVGPEVLVGICVERSLEMVVGLLGILKAGGAYVPLDPAYPPERLAFMLEDAQVGVLLTQARLVESLPKYQGRIVCLDTDWEIIERQSKENPECRFTPENLAYVIYTSGSTGKPKGVLVAHSGVSNLATALIQICDVQPNSRVLQFCSLSFDGSVTELVMALLSGATLVMGTRDSLLPGSNLIQLLRDFRVTTVALLPSVLAVLPANELPALRTVIAAGEACSRELVAKWSAGRRFFNGYGPTECTVCTTMVECTDSKEAPPIGRPLPNTEVYILDSQKQLVPIGVPGELYIGGVGVTRGYLNRPELTAERFILNPFSNDSGSRLYKTGDLARYLPDGNIEYLGRIDHQVKIRGFRIELGEIEAVLRQHRAVQDAVVIGLEYDLHDNRLVAYVVPSHEQVLSTSELRNYLKEKLPGHMVPSAFVRLEALPLTPNDKVDRRALPMPDGIRSVEENFAPPLTSFEEVLARIWREVLRLDSVGIHDNFFELGGHSLLAVRLLEQIEKTFGKNLPLATLFQSPTIEQLAKILHQSGWSSPWFSLVPIQPSGSRPPFFGIHSLGKAQEYYRNIARHLGSDQPVYGLDYWLATQTKDRKQALNTWRVEELAAHYIKEMRILQPEGPYFLAGFSFGGIVAYEMASQLVKQDQKVALLVLFDTRCPALSLKSLDFKTFEIHLKKLSQLEMKEKFAYITIKVKYKIQDNLKWIKPFFLKVAEKFYLKFKLPMPYALHYSLIVEADNKLASDYALQVYPGQVTLFRTTEQAVRYDQFSDLGWSARALGGVEIHEVPGDHLDMFQEPHVQMLAEKLRACIDKALQDVSEDHSSEPKKSTTSVEYQTNFLDQERFSALQSSLVPIQPHGLKPPLFCIHVLGRGLQFYLPLAHHFALEQPLYGLAAQMLHKKYAPPNRVEDLAAHYIKEMRIIQPDGPYFLAGLSFGGLVAFEIAQQLVAQGQQVALLALLDTYAPGAVQRVLARKRMSARWNKFLQVGPTYILKKTIKRLNDKLNHNLKGICCKFYLSIGQPLPNNLQDFTFQQENIEAASNYVPQAYPGRVTLFQAMDEIAGVTFYRDPLLGWGELAVGGLEIHGVPSTHLGMLQEPHVQVLAEKLKASIEDRVQGDDLAHIPPLCKDPLVCDNEDSEGYHIQTSSGLT